MGLIVYEPLVQLIGSILLMVVLAGFFFTIKYFYIKVSSVKVSRIIFGACSLITLYLMIVVGVELIEYSSWGFYLLALQEFMLIMLGVFALVHLSLSRHAANSL